MVFISLGFSETIAKTLFLSSKSTNNLKLNFIVKRYAGHSKWQNIMHTKAAKDEMRSQTFSKLRTKIVSAIRENGDDPQANFKLKKLIEEAKKLNMPKATLEKMLHKAKTMTSDKPYWLFYTRPTGLLVGFEVQTSNAYKAISTINSYAKKVDLKHVKNYSPFCTEKGIIISEPLKNTENAFDKALEDAIEAGIEEVFESDDKMLIFECKHTHVEGAHKKLSSLGYNVQSATTEIEFYNYVQMSDEEIQAINNVMDKLSDAYDELVRIVDNIQQ